MIQDIWRSKIDWDEAILDEEYKQWQRWISLTANLDHVRIPRCYFPLYNPGSYDELQLHVFVDASELAYCAVAYFRIVDSNGPRYVLVSAKSKVTPLRPQSIPRNELCAAVIGTRLSNTIDDNHSLKITQKFFWSDSSTVLSWLQSDPRNYRQFVGFRVAEILASTSPSEWNWVPSSLNIADNATKWGNGPSFQPDSPWFKGPEFLYRSPEEWPRRENQLNVTSEELRTVHLHLKPDYVAAEAAIWRAVQGDVFQEEITIIRKNHSTTAKEKKCIGRFSTLAKLSLLLDEQGVLRMDSRIHPQSTYYSISFRNVTSLLILRFHQKFGHANTETVLNELKQEYYIPKMRATVKKTLKQCSWCRVYRVKPYAPKMAPLPQPRITPFVRPFTFTGIDYFGPVIIKRGRCNEKRWVALFTCLTIRAVHLEVVHTLSSDSCKMAIRRFITKHGPPKEIFSDNGTNFRGASRELKEEIINLNFQLAKSFTNKFTAWNFNPPSAPHMGGVWERKVRSIKQAFKTLSYNEKLDEESLKTFLAEAELIVNSHPLTFVSLENQEDEVITPNSFLWPNSSEGDKPPRIPIDAVVNLRTNWKSVQHLTNRFWKCWIKSYLPTIARRTKWFSDVRPLQIGDLVVIVDESVRNGWLRGTVERVYPGCDGVVHKVDVRTADGIFQRPVIKVALLDVKDDSKTE
ncbi:uncharacterized protein LOC129737943 [Uranotaenia lowii]|uniref:uncharacterized protein LOC129737943 n=1 Tax=Uranotaenia lowii TaxID=190385 RepID=UPI002479562E|nr:uncharacterized protein LOC129737943 [Uranotaenia lowii]